MPSENSNHQEINFLTYFRFPVENLQKIWQSKEITAHSYQKTLNLNNIKNSLGIEFVLCNCMGEIDHLAVWITHFYFISIYF